MAKDPGGTLGGVPPPFPPDSFENDLLVGLRDLIVEYQFDLPHQKIERVLMYFTYEVIMEGERRQAAGVDITKVEEEDTEDH